MSRLRGPGALHRQARRPDLYQCNACRKQTSVKAGTIFASSKLPLRLWFKAMYLLTQSKKGFPASNSGGGWRHADNRLDPQAQTRPSHDRAQRGQAIERRRATGRRLSRRAPLRHKRSRRCGENALRRRRVRDQRWQTRPDRASPRRRLRNWRSPDLRARRWRQALTSSPMGFAPFPP